MTFFQASILGIVQGLTEFLPVSSSGHLVLVQSFFKLSTSTVSFDIFLHFATLLAVIIFFKKDLLKISREFIFLIVVASIPAGLVGVFFEDYISSLFSSELLVGLTLILTGILNLLTDYKLNNSTTFLEKIKPKQALIIGLFQAFALLPGLSRSGSTVFAGVWQTLDRKLAFKFSFLMSIPVIFGANLIHVFKILKDSSNISGVLNEVNILPLIFGGVLAFITGFLSLKLLEMVMTKSKIGYFGYYCLSVGLIVVIINLLNINFSVL